jgi:hypothetical protein
MEGKIKTAIEIAMEKAALLEDLSLEEKEEIENKKKLEPIMAGFYKTAFKPEDLWNKLKNGNPSLLKMAQISLVDSLKFNLDGSEIDRRIKGIIALESLKKEQKTSVIQQALAMLVSLQKKAENERTQVFNQFKNAIEKNPQARNRVIEQGGAKIVLKLSVEEAVLQNPQWKQFMTEFESNNEQEFSRITEQVKKYL